MSIYVEILIRGSMDELWRRTQDPALHQQWDLRFTSIDYLPREGEAVPQQFRYSTKLGFGIRIEGEGVSAGSQSMANGASMSALRFSSDDSKSLIREGSGYWKYVPTVDGVRFLTWYEYQTRFGIAGRLFDLAIFRPLIGWATAWSFDRLRLWMERGLTRDGDWSGRLPTRPRGSLWRLSSFIMDSSPSCWRTMRTSSRCSQTLAFPPR